jgi:hypothetical protein
MSATVERRPGIGTEAADEDQAKSLDIKVPQVDRACPTVSADKYDGPDDPRWQAAELLADSWGPALASSYHLGYETGYARGYRDAEQDMERSWTQMRKKIRATMAYPTNAELKHRRGED